MPVFHRAQQNRSVSGFSLVELLTVIAIIAILAAIIFPVFATVRENARQSTSLSNLHDISTKLGMYQLDHHTYPPVLFGYVYRDASGTKYPMDKALAQVQSDCSASANQQACVAQYFPGLYPEYINNINEFTDPNNDVDFSATWQPATNFLCTGITTGVNPDDAACTIGGVDTPGRLVPTTLVANFKDFYRADAYDASPKVTGPNAIENSTSSPPTPVTRYQPSWTSITDTGDATKIPSAGPPVVTNVLYNWEPTQADGSPAPPSPTVQNDINKNDIYIRQLRWRNPPPDAFVTCTTYHVPTSNQILVLYAGGNARKFDYTQFVARGGDVDSVAVPTGQYVAQGSFWQVKPDGH